MALANPSFEDPGAVLGEAAAWVVRSFVAAERICGFGTAPALGWEDFERWTALQLRFGAADLALGVFDPLPEGYEDFEEAWDNDHYLDELPTGEVVVGLFAGDAVERLEHGWANDSFVADWNDVAAVLGQFDGEPHEDFEDGWLANETFVALWSTVAAVRATFAPAALGYEAFTAWAATTTI